MTMPGSGEDLRPSAPMMSAKDLLLDVWRDVKELNANVSVLMSQDLGHRVTELEKARATEAGEESVRANTIHISRATLALLVSLVVPAAFIFQAASDILLRILGVQA